MGRKRELMIVTFPETVLNLFSLSTSRGHDQHTEVRVKGTKKPGLENNFPWTNLVVGSSIQLSHKPLLTNYEQYYFIHCLSLTHSISLTPFSSPCFSFSLSISDTFLSLSLSLSLYILTSLNNNKFDVPFKYLIIRKVTASDPKLLRKIWSTSQKDLVNFSERSGQRSQGDSWCLDDV